MWEVEHTDTFGGEANYCWVRRYSLPEYKGKEPSRLALVRKAKALTGLTGYRCKVTNYGDMISIHPVGICQVVFITYNDRA